MLGGIVGPVVKVGAEWLERRGRIAEAKTNAQITLVERRAQADVNWENIWAQGAATSWKDEYMLFILSIPLILAFIPPMIPHVVAGFAALELLPGWYHQLLFVAVSATFGIRGLQRGADMIRKPKNTGNSNEPN